MNHADAFRWISVAVSMILGLGIARLLTALVAQFLARRHRTANWIALAWAAAIFLHQVSFWWSLVELSSIVPRWTAASFLLLLGLVLLLFVAAALVLPHSDNAEITRLDIYFAIDGRWCLPALTAFNLLAIAANIVFWHVELVSAAFALNLLLALLPAMAFFATRRVQAALTVGYLVLLVITVLDLAPAAY